MHCTGSKQPRAKLTTGFGVQVNIRINRPKPRHSGPRGTARYQSSHRVAQRGSTLLPELAVPETDDLDVLGCLGAQISVGRLDRLEDSGDLASQVVDLETQADTQLEANVIDLRTQRVEFKANKLQ